MPFGQITCNLLRTKKNEIFVQPVKYYRTRYGKGDEGLTIKHDISPLVDPPAGVERFVFNRNPRNLERLSIANRQEGWSLEKKLKTFYHKLVISEGFREIKVSCVHQSGKVVLSASTDEWCIRKFLHKSQDKCACTNLGRVFAHRCLQAGLTEMISEYNLDSEGKVALIAKEIENGGVTFKEPEQLVLRNFITKVKPPRPWDVTIE